MPDLRKQAHDLGRPFTDQYGTSEDETMHEDAGSLSMKKCSEIYPGVDQWSGLNK